MEVLLLERDPQFATLVIRGLEASGVLHRVHWSREAADAIGAVFGAHGFASREAGKRLKLALLGVGPSLAEDALAALHRLKSDARTLPMPVVTFAPEGAAGALARCRAMGANGCVQLPAEAQALVGCVARLGRYWLAINRTLR